MPKSKRIRQVILLALLVLVLFIGNRYQVNSSTTSSTGTALVFKHKIIDPSPPSGSKCCLDVLALGDIDGDRQLDVMVGSQNSIGLVWYRYPFWKRYSIGRGEFSTDGEIADVDGDGDKDVVVSNYGRDAIEWWENRGKPFASSGWVRHEIGAKFSHDVSVGDLNGDRHLDVVMFRKDEPRQLTWFEAPNDPRGKWLRHQVDTPLGEGLDLGDVDGDGDLDIAASSSWYENQDAQGLSWHRHGLKRQDSAWGQDMRNAIADLNDDGKKDILLSHAEGEGRFSWFENPSWSEHVIEPKTLKGAHSLAVGDFDLDGDRDIAIGEMNTGSGRVMVYQNQGNAKAWQRTILATTGTHNAQVGDLGADGDLDIVGKNYTGEKVVELWENATSTKLDLR